MKKLIIALLPLLLLSSCLSIPYIKDARIETTDGLKVYGHADYDSYSTKDKKIGMDIYLGAKYGNGFFEAGAETDLALLMDINTYLKIKILDDDGWSIAACGFADPRFVAQLYEYGGLALFSKSWGNVSLTAIGGYSKVKNEYVYSKQFYNYGLGDFPGDVDFMNLGATIAIGDFSLNFLYKKGLRAAERSAFSGLKPDNPDTMLFSIGLDVPNREKGPIETDKDPKVEIPVNDNL